MRKIVLYIDFMKLGGGAQRVMNCIAGYLAEQGYRVILINDILPSDGEPEYPVDSRIERLFLDKEKFSPQGGKIAKVQNNIVRIFRLRQLIRQEKPAEVLAFLGAPNIRMLIATIGLPVKTMVSVRNDPCHTYGGGLRKLAVNLVFRLADGCVFQTREAAEYFSKKVRDRSRIIMNPVDEKFYHVEWTGEKREVAVVGRLQPQKNPFLALHAFGKIAGEFPDWKLVYYGFGELKEGLIERSKELGIDHQVLACGKVADIEQKLASSAVYVLSSDYEGMPNALLEAMAVGVPAVSTDCPCGGPRMVIESEAQGLLVPVGDVDKMADALRRLLADEALRKKMSAAEKRKAEAFHIDRVMLQWRDYIEALAEGCVHG